MGKRKVRQELDDQARSTKWSLGPNAVELSRREIIQAEIESAIELFYRDRAIVAAHLLISAANEILDRLTHELDSSLQRGVVWRVLDKIAGPEVSAEAQEFFNLPYRFFKHSSSDLDVKIRFWPEALTLVELQTAIVAFRHLFRETSPTMDIVTAIQLAGTSLATPSVIEVANVLGIRLDRKLDLDEMMRLGAEMLAQRTAEEMPTAGRIGSSGGGSGD